MIESKLKSNNCHSPVKLLRSISLASLFAIKIVTPFSYSSEIVVSK